MRDAKVFVLTGEETLLYALDARVAAAARDARGAVEHAAALGRAHRTARRSDGWKRHDSDRGGRPRRGCFKPPFGVRIGGEHGEAALLALYADLGRALGRLSDWRAACFVANPKFVYALVTVPP
jgi:hypothetical protein